MSEETNTPQQDQNEPVMRHELVEIIDVNIQLLATMEDLRNDVYDDQQEDIIKIYSSTYKLILSAQRKLMQQIRTT